MRWFIALLLVYSEYSYGNIQKLVSDSIFEIVTDKHDDFPVFDRPLDKSDIPYAERVSTHRSIGTAFFVNSEVVISAAHVINLYARSTELGSYYLKDKENQIHEINSILAYDNERDYVAFTLKTYPKSIVPLVIKVAGKDEVGEDVCAPGNAIGEGISYRCGGQLAGYTPEAIDGRWENIRFSTPASPGNSGGPLLTKDAKVIGVIVRKSASENLNVATPMSEVKLENHIVVREPKFQIQETTGPITRSPLSLNYSSPMPLPDLWKKIQRDIVISWSKLRKKHRQDHREKIFPYNEKIFTSIKNGASPDDKGGVLHSEDGESWGFVESGLKEILTKKQNKLIIGEKKYLGFVPFYTPKTIDQPQEIVDNLLKEVPVKVDFFGQKYRFTSYGAHDKQYQVKDIFRRPWTVSVWDIKSLEQRIVTFCSPLPSGSFCFLNNLPFSTVTKASLQMYLDGLAEFIFPYSGSQEEWKAFLQREDTPKFLTRSFQTDGTFAAKFRKKRVPVESDESITFLPSYFMGKKRLFLKQKKLVIQSTDDDSKLIVYETINKPTEDAEQDKIVNYNKIAKREFPFNSQLINQENIYLRMEVMSRSKSYQIIRQCLSQDPAVVKDNCEN